MQRSSIEPRVPAVIAHRGASHDAPENTLAAFNLAWQQDADGIETDVYLSRDGAIVCIHNPTTLHTTGQDIRLAEAMLAELRRLDVGRWKGAAWAGARIPTLAETLAAVPEGKTIFIEIKCGPEIAPALEQALENSGLRPGQAVVIAFDAQVIVAVKRRLPRLNTLWLTDFRADHAAGVWRPSADEILATLSEIGADGVDCTARPIVDREFMRAFRAARKTVNIWTVDDAPTAQALLGLGVDSITTNRPGWLKRLSAGKPPAG